MIRNSEFNGANDLEKEKEAFAKLIAFSEEKRKAKPNMFLDEQTLDERAEQLKKDPKVAELAKSLTGSKALNQFGKRTGDPLDLAGELSKLYDGKLTVKQWKEQQKGAKQKQEQEPEKEQGPEQGQEKAAEKGADELRKIVLPAYVKAVRQMQEQAEKQAQASKQKKTEKQMNQPAEQEKEKGQKSKPTEQQAQTGKQKKTEDQPTR